MKRVTSIDRGEGTRIGAKALLGRWHRDDRGAMSVFALVVLWLLVLMLGMMWNTAEQATRREHLQTAADAAAHATATWIARSVNAVSAQNMVICQDASTEVLWSSVRITHTSINLRLAKEKADASALRGSNPIVRITRRMATMQALIANEYVASSDALTQIEGFRLNPQYFKDKKEQDDFGRQVKLARDNLNYIDSVIVPELNNYKANLPPLSVNDTIIDHIIDWINRVEIPYNEGFFNQTRDATSNDHLDSDLKAHEGEVYQQQGKMLAGFSDSVEQARQQLADAYKVDLTLATLPRPDDAPASGTPQVRHPLKSAGDPQPIQKSDGIRQVFAMELPPGMSTEVTIDPINPHTWDYVSEDDHSQDNRIWFPDQQLTINNRTFKIRCMPPNPRDVASTEAPDFAARVGWGELWAAPLERYFHARVNGDLNHAEASLDSLYLQPLDRSRTIDLRAWIKQQLMILDLDFPVLDAIMADLNAHLPPNLSPPSKASVPFTVQITQYNQHKNLFVSYIREYIGLFREYLGVYNEFVDPFASDQWHFRIDQQRRRVQHQLGRDKAFAILATYDLHYLPEWAKNGMQQQVYAAVREQIIAMNVIPVILFYMNQGYSPNDAATAARGQVGQVASYAAAMISEEWVSRPWPYEFVPPDQQVPPSRGITDSARKGYFSVLAGARQRQETGAKTLFSKIFGADATQLVAFGQAEAFNWFEYDASYGGADRYDNITYDPWAPYGSDYPHFTGAPRQWRTASVPGWNWRARLSLADMLPDLFPESVAVNPELADYLSSAGIDHPDPESLRVLIAH